MPDSVIKNTFRKPEKICNQKQIDRLFKEGRSLKSGQFRLLYIQDQATDRVPLQVLIAIPKRNLRHAVSRNRMKRLVREAYRHNKHKILDIYTTAGISCDIAFIFTGKQCISQQETSTAIIELLDRLIRAHEKNSE